MGRKLTPSEEAHELRLIIREAHEATKALRQALRLVTRLEPDLVAEFQGIHDREIRQLETTLQAELNQASAALNRSVADARIEILRQLSLSEIVIDRLDGSFRVQFDGGVFDEHATPRKSPPPRGESSS